MKKSSKILKLIIAILIILSFGLITNQVCAASSPSDISMTDIMNAGSDWIKEGKSAQTGDTGVDDFAKQLSGVGQILVAVGVATLLIVTAIMAVRWITASPDKKATLKQQTIGIVVAAIVIFGAVGIWNLVRGIMGKVEDEMVTASNDDLNGKYIQIAERN